MKLRGNSSCVRLTIKNPSLTHEMGFDRGCCMGIYRTLDPVKDLTERGRLKLVMIELYGKALKASSREWKELFERALASENTSTKLTSRQSCLESEIENALEEPSSRINTAGIPSHQTKSVTLSQSNKLISKTSNMD